MSRHHRGPLIPVGAATLKAQHLRQARQHEATQYVIAAEHLHKQGTLQAALNGYHRAIRLLGPEFLTHPAGKRAGFLAALGAYQLRLYDEAVLLMEAVRTADWHNPHVHYNLGLIYGAARAPEAAAESYRIAIALDPSHAAAENNLGNTLRELGDFEGAELCYARLIAADPQEPAARYNLSHVALLRGDLARGFALYEDRWKVDGWVAEYGRPDITSPRLAKGTPGQHVFVHQEQGIGDTLQFVRYLHILWRLGYRVTFESPVELASWLKGIERPGLDVIAKGEPIPAHDCHIPLLSIPAHFGIQSEADIAPMLELPVRKPSPLWTDAGDTRDVIGFAWAGNPKHHNDHNRTAPLAQLAPLFTRPNTRFVSLQPGDRGVELLNALPSLVLGEGSEIVDVTAHLRDFEVTAALAKQCKAIVCVDTSIAHLGGVLRVPTFILTSWLSEWRWQLDRTDSPWYPSVRLVRQPTLGDWPSTAREALTLLEAL